MRGTVHLIPTEDYWWLAPLYRDRHRAISQRRLEQLGIAGRQRDRAIAAVAKALEAEGSLGRGAAMEVAARTGFAVNVETRTHLAMLLVVEGIACIGPNEGRESGLVARRDWIGEGRSPDREDCLAELARRYLGAFAPASASDFSSWSGLPLRDCRVGLGAIAGELREVRHGGRELLALKGYTARSPRSSTVRLLPAFDTYLMGYASREHAVDEEGERRILPGGGILRPAICVDGRFVGLWSSKRSGRKLTVELNPFEPLDDDVLSAIQGEVADVGRFEEVEARLV